MSGLQNRRGYREYERRAQRLDEHRIAQNEAPVIERVSQHEVADALHEAAQHQDGQRSDRQQREQQGDGAESDVIPTTEIDQAGTKAAGNRRVAAPFENPALQRNDQRDHQQCEARQHGRFAVVGNLISDQGENLGRIDEKAEGHAQQVFGLERLKHAQQLQREDHHHRRDHQRQGDFEERSSGCSRRRRAPLPPTSSPCCERPASAA